MIFVSLLTLLLLANAAFSAPEAAITRRHRHSNGHRSKPLHRLGRNTDMTAPTVNTSEINTSDIEYSSNWAGAVWNSYPSNTFYKITGTFTVPEPSAPNGNASVWVGIDGDGCGQGLLQTGIAMNYRGGSITYDAWYEWYPAYAYTFRKPIDIEAGDVLRLTVTASSTTSGTAFIDNLTKKQSVSQYLSYPSYPLCRKTAEWIVEDFTTGDEPNPPLDPFCNFGTVVFSNTSAYLNNGQAISAYGAAGFDLKQNGTVLASVSADPSGTVTINYVPEGNVNSPDLE